MGKAMSVKELIQDMAVRDMRIVMGRVTQENPLNITLINDDKMTLHPGIICLPRHLADYTVPCSFVVKEGEVTGELNGKITIKNALKSGEIVYILSFNHGKKYYILDRED